MRDYMREAHMPWPAIRYDEIAASGLAQYAGRGIPCLVMLDADGKVVSHSYSGQTYLGPQHVLEDLEKQR
jgi:nucleoredoxin